MFCTSAVASSPVQCGSPELVSTYDSSSYVFIADIDHEQYPANTDSRLSKSMKRVLGPDFKAGESLVMVIHQNLKGETPGHLTGRYDPINDACPLNSLTKYIFFLDDLSGRLSLSGVNSIPVSVSALVEFCTVIDNAGQNTVVEVEACVRLHL